MNDNFAIDLLERYTPPALDAAPAWGDVLERAGIARTMAAPVVGSAPFLPRRRSSLKRSLVVAVAAIAGAVVLAAVTPAGSAIVRSFGDFSAWLTGLPGKPAPRSDRDALNRATRSWFAFPQGTRLHRLSETKVDGITLALDGFRVGDSLCLQVVATGLLRRSDQSCVPLSELRTQAAPALVLLADTAFGTIGGKHVQIGPYLYTHSVRVDVTIGIVADGVNRVDVLGSSGGLRQALIGGDAFMAIADRPPVAYRTRHAWATVAGKRVVIPLAEAPFDQLNTASSKPRKPLGPSRLQRRVQGGKIGWLDRREPRGDPVPTTGTLARLDHGPFLKRILFQRLIAPDPNSPLKEIVRLQLASSPFSGKTSVQVCNLLVDGSSAGGGCDPASKLFGQGPMNIGESLPEGGDQYEPINGLTSDDVDRVEMFLATGERIAVPLLDNVFIAQVARSSFPVRVVAYDHRNRRIGVQTLADDAGGSRAGPSLAAGAKWRVILRATSLTGKTAQTLIAAKADGGICFSFRVSDGSSQGGCTSKRWRGPAVRITYSSFTNTEGPGFVWGQVRPGIATVAVQLANGTTLHLKPLHGLVLAALPRGFRPGPGDTVIGYNNHGQETAHQRLPNS